MQIVVPMAGKGSRFAEAANLNPEYSNPKPLIKVKGKPLIKWSLESFPQNVIDSSKLIFICLQEHETTHNISTRLRELFGNNIQIKLINQVTRGAAETALKVKDLLDPNEDLIILDCDIYFDGHSLYKKILNKGPEVEGIIPVIKPPDQDPKWSYALFDQTTDIVSEVAEKDPILAKQGAYASIGGYYFSKASNFINEAQQMITENTKYGPEDKQEFFIAPIYGRLIAKGLIIQAATLDYFWNLGTPSDLELFLRNYHD